MTSDPVISRLIGSSDATVAVAEAAQAFVIAGLVRFSNRRPVLVVTPTELAAQRLAGDLSCFLDDGLRPGRRVGGLDESVVVLPAWETLPLERVSPEVETMGRRSAVFWHLLRAPQVPSHSTRGGPQSGPQSGPQVVVASVRSVLQRLVSVNDLTPPLVVTKGSHMDLNETVEYLVSAGYRRESQVEHRGEIAVRGGIVDVFPSTAEMPVRIDLFGDDVERLTVFDVGDQRSIDDIDSATVFGCREITPTGDVRVEASRLIESEPWGSAQWERLSRGESFDGMEAWAPWLSREEVIITDLLGPDARVVLVDPRRIRDRAAEVCDEESALTETLSETWGIRGLDETPASDGEASDGEASDGQGSVRRLHLPFDRLLSKWRGAVVLLPPVPEGPDVASVNVGGIAPVTGDAKQLVTQVTQLLDRGFSVTLTASNEVGAERLSAALASEGVIAPVVNSPSTAACVQVVRSPLTSGFVLPGSKVAVVSESDVTGRRVSHRRARARQRPADGFFDDLTPGSFVVHRQHGVARFSQVTTKTIAGTTRDYLVLQFRGTDRIYLPFDQIEAVTPYTGGESPTLSKMGGSDWQRTKAKARAAADEVAADLVELYRRRLTVEGVAFGPDTPWQRELESSFPYSETADQLRAVQEVKSDMEQPRPMDRLVCGDVGFGKTEVALRAVFKAVQDGKQVAVLVPTTLLASQHYQTFSQRFSGYPIRVELLSRFLSGSETRSVVAGLRDGSVDVVVGTHRLLANDIVYKDLGLLVVDEEQRFGVGHKEAVKRIADGIDVLTLTASPIPRTLEMALTGIRDMSMIQTPPAERRPILTYVGEYDEAAVSEAIRRELLREGQVFFIHNRVVDIDAVARRLLALVPQARVAVAHGQMDEGSLEQVVIDFWEHKADVLVCTTIIESGIDMPAVNTLVVDRADLLGLGQLHQIRGRVGRGDQRAYAYLFYPADRVLTEQAYERLRTIGEHTDLGSGFKIAMRDLEIRGAGNLLGSDQSGYISAVGYDLYVQLVAEAVADVRGIRRETPRSVSLDIPGDAHLPTGYVGAEDMRLESYRRLASVTTLNEVEDVRTEWADRFGKLPPAAEGLISLTRLRVECLRTKITEISVAPARPGGARNAVARISPVRLGASAQVRLRSLAKDATYKEALSQLTVPLKGETNAAEYLVELVSSLFPADG